MSNPLHLPRELYLNLPRFREILQVKRPPNAMTNVLKHIATKVMTSHKQKVVVQLGKTTSVAGVVEKQINLRSVTLAFDFKKEKISLPKRKIIAS